MCFEEVEVMRGEGEEERKVRRGKGRERRWKEMRKKKFG
jgi:hypothetical protein